MNKLNLKLKEDLDPNQIIPIRKGLDGPVVEEKDWLTPLTPGTEFVVRSSSKDYITPIFLDFYKKIHTYNNCTFLIEELNGEEISRYVITKNFINRYELIEVLHVGE